MQGIGIAVTRETDAGEPAGGWVPDERITLDEALTAYTLGVARQAGEESLWGALHIGMRADVVVFDRDLHRTDAHDLRRVQVTGTWLAGERVFG
jgi:predicted amidohydrolase YtcJ